MCLMETDPFDVAFSAAEKALNDLEKAQAKAVEAALAEQVREIEAAKWSIDFSGLKDGVFAYLICGELTELIPVGSLQHVFEWDMEHIAEGDVVYGEQLLADLQKLVARTEAALIEGRKHPF